MGAENEVSQVGSVAPKGWMGKGISKERRRRFVCLFVIAMRVKL